MPDHQASGRDRRIQARYTVDLHAKVRGANQLPASCRVLNICNGGVLLDTPASEPELPFKRGEHIDLYFDLPDAQSMDPVQAVIEVSHRVDRGLGARFIRLAGDGRMRLARFIRETAARQSPPAEDTGHHPVQARAREVLEQVGQQRLGTLLDSLLETLVDELWRHSERTETDAERTRFAGEIALLARAIQNESVPRQLRQQLLDALRNLGLGASAPSVGQVPDNPAEGLQLVDQDAFEIWLAKSELANRLEQELHEPLESLRNHLAGLFHDAALPVEPLALAETIEQALQEIGVGLQLQRLSMQIVANHLSRNLGAFYREVLNAWVSAGLDASGSPSAISGIPDLPPSAAPVGNPVDSPPETAPSPGTAAPDIPVTPPGATTAAADALSSTQAVAGTIANLLAATCSPIKLKESRQSRAFAGGQHIADLLASLPANEQIAAADPDLPLRELVAKWLVAAEARQPGASSGRQPLMSPQVEERVEVTDRLLSHMLADPVTPPQVKSLIKPLTTRLLAMTLAGSGAVADGRQPLINLINRLEHLARFLPGDEDSHQGLQREFGELAQKLVSSDGQDPQALGDLSKRLGKLESRVGHEYQDNVTNWIKVCESRERERLAREAVRKHLNTAFAGRRMHRIVDELLLLGWRGLLELVCVNVGIEGPRWRNLWWILCDLHGLTGGEEPTAEPFARRATGKDLKALIQEVRAALAYIGADPILCDDLLGRLETAVRRAQAAMDRDDDYLLYCPAPPDPDNAPEKIPAGVSQADWERGLAQVGALPLGDLIWMRGKEADKALRLIWRNEDGSRLAVTDTLAKKLKVLHRGRLAEAFARGQARAETPNTQPMVTRAADAALSEMQQRLVHHEHQDVLTGLADQRRLVGALTELLLTERGLPPAYALFFLELDRYDTLTGTYGYSAGERMLQAVARLLEGVVADAVCLAYLGGSRFGLLMPACDQDHAVEIGESIRAGLAVMNFDLQGRPYRISGSLGIAMLTSDSSSPEKLMSAASVACLAAQREGGDHAVLFTEDNAIIARQLEYMRGWAQTDDVIKAGRRRLRYQRIVPINPAAELLPHCEILLSVYDQQGNPLPLQSFIATAEAFNRMREVDRQVIDDAFSWVHHHPDKVSAVGGVAINLSGQSLSDPGLLNYIRAALERLQIPVELVSFEVTETAAIVNLDQAAILLADIRSLGCSIALDDFGAGMSSYSYLKHLPVDYVKIDGSFIKDILVSPHDREIVKSFNEIAHFMGKKTIAEYVENLEILELLRDIGVDYAQGYAIEKPQFIDEMI